MKTIEVFQQILKCKWTLMILARFRDGIQRPGQLRRSIKGLSSKVMYERLRMLEDNGIIKREVKAVKPLEVQYALTEKGQYIRSIIDLMEDLD